MLVYCLYKSLYTTEPLSAEGPRRAGGRWNLKGYPILYTSATTELALLEVLAHLKPAFIPAFHLLVLDVPDSFKAVSVTELPNNWQTEQQDEFMQTYLADWLNHPDELIMAVPLVIVSRSTNYLIHSLHPKVKEAVRIVENKPFEVNSRLIKKVADKFCL